MYSARPVGCASPVMDRNGTLGSRRDPGPAGCPAGRPAGSSASCPSARCPIENRNGLRGAFRRPSARGRVENRNGRKRNDWRPAGRPAGRPGAAGCAASCAAGSGCRLWMPARQAIKLVVLDEPRQNHTGPSRGRNAPFGPLGPLGADAPKRADCALATPGEDPVGGPPGTPWRLYKGGIPSLSHPGISN